MAEVVERYQAGETAPELAKAFGLKRCRVYKLLHDRGVMRSQSEAGKLEMARRLAERRGK